MIYLLDVSTLMALLWGLHAHNDRATRWQSKGAKLAICPITELGFLRISTQPVFGASMAEAVKMLKDFKEATGAKFVSCDLEASEMHLPNVGSKTTDFYLASLADKHGMKLATLDEGIGHKSAFVIPA